jgi:hypothetical protein
MIVYQTRNPDQPWTSLVTNHFKFFHSWQPIITPDPYWSTITNATWSSKLTKLLYCGRTSCLTLKENPSPWNTKQRPYTAHFMHVMSVPTTEKYWNAPSDEQCSCSTWRYATSTLQLLYASCNVEVVAWVAWRSRVCITYCIRIAIAGSSKRPI